MAKTLEIAAFSRLESNASYSSHEDFVAANDENPAGVDVICFPNSRYFPTVDSYNAIGEMSSEGTALWEAALVNARCNGISVNCVVLGMITDVEIVIAPSYPSLRDFSALVREANGALIALNPYIPAESNIPKYIDGIAYDCDFTGKEELDKLNDLSVIHSLPLFKTGNAYRPPSVSRDWAVEIPEELGNAGEFADYIRSRVK